MLEKHLKVLEPNLKATTEFSIQILSSEYFGLHPLSQSLVFVLNLLVSNHLVLRQG